MVDQEDIFKYLDGLRQAGIIGKPLSTFNPTYSLRIKFSLSRDDARAVLRDWENIRG